MDNNNETTLKKISELPDSIREKIYDLRLNSDKDIPIDEYIVRTGTVLVDKCLYYGSDDDSMDIIARYSRLQNYGYTTGLTYLPNVIINDGQVIKNRFGGIDISRSSDIFDSYLDLKESYYKTRSEISDLCDDWLIKNWENLCGCNANLKLSHWWFDPNQKEPRKVTIFYSYDKLNGHERKHTRVEVPVDELL